MKKQYMPSTFVIVSQVIILLISIRLYSTDFFHANSMMPAVSAFIATTVQYVLFPFVGLLIAIQIVAAYKHRKKRQMKTEGSIKIAYRLKRIEVELGTASTSVVSEALKKEQTELIVQLKNEYDVDYFDALKVEAVVNSSDKSN